MLWIEAEGCDQSGEGLAVEEKGSHRVSLDEVDVEQQRYRRAFSHPGNVCFSAAQTTGKRRHIRAIQLIEIRFCVDPGWSSDHGIDFEGCWFYSQMCCLLYKHKKMHLNHSLESLSVCERESEWCVCVCVCGNRLMTWAVCIPASCLVTRTKFQQTQTTQIVS